MIPLIGVDRWRKELGLLPVPLFAADTKNRYVLLNGSQGNFCLDFDDTELDPRATAWSSNVGHYVSVRSDTTRVHRWDRSPASSETFATSDVLSALERFHHYLEAKPPDLSQSAIAHAIRVFRSLRTALGAGYSGTQALGAYLTLFACAADGTAIGALDIGKWGLPPEGVHTAEEVPVQQWEMLGLELQNGRALDRLPLDLTLLLRHAAGTLFQEAHYEAIFHHPDQLSLGLFVPPPASVSSVTAAVGLHFTPPAIVRTLVEEGLRVLFRKDARRQLTVFDPACGSGEFLREALRQLMLRGFDQPVRLIGWDISPAACAMARFALAWEARNAPNATVEIVSTDSIKATWPQGIDAILMNPPFVAWPDISAEHQELMKAALGSSYKHRPDLSAYFIVRATQALNPSGVLATVTPASFLDATSTAEIRDQLSVQLSLETVGRLGSHDIFPGAKVDAGVFVAERSATGADTVAVWADAQPTSASGAMRALRRVRSTPGGVLDPVETDHFSIYSVKQVAAAGNTWAPRPYTAWNLLHGVRQDRTVADLFSVRQGALTGLNRAFILTRRQFAALPAKEKPYFRPAVLNDSVSDGRLEVSAYVFYPYGPVTIRSDKELRARAPNYAETLNEWRAELTRRAGVSPQNWWQLTRPREWQVVPGPKIVSTYFGTEGSFAWDQTGEFVVVQGYGWLPRGRKALSVTLWHAYLALLTSRVFGTLLSAVSNHVGGGQWNLSKRFVEKIPFPDLGANGTTVDLVHGLADIGKLIAARGTGALPSERRSDWDELVRSAYGLVSSG
jgi:adenine-specific DNA-methyltransferase